jgi:hypothetical protein
MEFTSIQYWTVPCPSLPLHTTQEPMSDEHISLLLLSIKMEINSARGGRLFQKKHFIKQDWGNDLRGEHGVKVYCLESVWSIREGDRFNGYEHKEKKTRKSRRKRRRKRRMRI